MSVKVVRSGTLQCEILSVDGDAVDEDETQLNRASKGIYFSKS